MRLPGNAMALDHPTLNLPIGGTLRGSRVLELGVVVVLTVAVVVVAALWGSRSDSIEPVSLGAVEPVSQVPAQSTAEAAEPTQPATNVETVAVATSAQSNSANTAQPTVTLPEHDRTTLTAETVAAGEIPEFAGRSLPSSFERYQVQRGETLDSIAETQGLTVSELVLWNSHLDEDSVLIPGEWLSIPQWDGSAVADELGLAEDDGKSGRGGG